MKLKKYPHIIFLLITASLTGCYYDKEEELYPMSQQECDTTNISYSTDIEPIIANNCATSGCHQAGGNGNGIFTNYAGLKAKVDNGSLHNRVVVVRDMPPNSSLPECQVDKIDAWINAGAPNN